MLRKPSEIIINEKSLDDILNEHKNSSTFTKIDLRGVIVSEVRYAHETAFFKNSMA